MAQVHMTEAELAQNVRGALDKVKLGIEVVVEQDHQPIAIIRPAARQGRLLSESIAIAEAQNCTATLDDGFMNDVEEGIASRSQPWKPPSWE